MTTKHNDLNNQGHEIHVYNGPNTNILPWPNIFCLLVNLIWAPDLKPFFVWQQSFV